MRIILVSKAAGGKDFFRDFIKRFKTVDVSYTTRPIRKGEEEWYTYNFISEESYKEMEKRDMFMESICFNGWNYGTSKSGWESNEVFIMTPSGISQISNLDRENCVIIFFDIPESIRRKRLELRSDADKTDRRLIADQIDFEYFSDFDIRITNPLFNPTILLELIKNYKYAQGRD